MRKQFNCEKGPSTVAIKEMTGCRPCNESSPKENKFGTRNNSVEFKIQPSLAQKRDSNL